MKKLLLQLDGDPHASSFDRIVAHDAAADDVLAYGGVDEDDVVGLVHGAIFTRALDELRNSAVFIGGSDVSHAEKLFEKARGAFFGPFRVSVMLDPNGTNTTAAAAVLKIVRAVGDLAGKRAVVLAGTGAVGTRACGLLAELGATVILTGRNESRASEEAEKISERYGVDVRGRASPGAGELGDLLDGAHVVLATGPEGLQLATEEDWSGASSLEVAADVNAVPPLGLEGIDRDDDGEERHGVTVFGAIGIGNFKMKIHKASIARLFESKDAELDAKAIYRLAEEM